MSLTVFFSQVFVVVAEEGGGFVEAAGEKTEVPVGGTAEVIGELRNMQDAVVFRGVNVVRAAVVIEKKRHVS